MVRGVLEWLLARFCSDEDAEDESQDSRFVPSVLDASVRYAHGGSNTELENEIAKMEDEAHRLEEQRKE